jgi:hypothetical protein
MQMTRNRTLKIATIGVLLVAGVLGGCSRANRAAWNAMGSPHHIIQYSGVKKIGEWCSTGKVNSEDHSDGKYFEDAKSGKLVMVSGHLLVSVGCPTH